MDESNKCEWNWQVGKGDLDVGKHEKGFSYEGEVKSGRQSGWGIEKYGARTQRYGQFLDGKTIGYCVADMKGVKRFQTWKNGYLRDEVDFDSNNELHPRIVSMASDKAAKAWKLANKPWSRKRNHYNKYLLFQPMILTVMLCNARLHNTGAITLPSEIWDMIIELTIAFYGFGSNHVCFFNFSNNLAM
eukprot:m.18348 g.18348  ORF g.18348 m.18348 type:complete len:188 (+) comp6289_c0_seq2:123-686(+)